MRTHFSDMLAVIDVEMAGCRTADKLKALGHVERFPETGRSVSSVVRAYRLARGL